MSILAGDELDWLEAWQEELLIDDILLGWRSSGRPRALCTPWLRVQREADRVGGITVRAPTLIRR